MKKIVYIIATLIVSEFIGNKEINEIKNNDIKPTVEFEHYYTPNDVCRQLFEYEDKETDDKFNYIMCSMENDIKCIVEGFKDKTFEDYKDNEYLTNQDVANISAFLDNVCDYKEVNINVKLD